jgi:hypothetical protein
MKTFDKVVAYVYKAEVMCPKCVRRALFTEGKVDIKIKTLPPEDILDLLAEELGLNRYDEYSFDSDFFPKVIFSSDIDFGEDNCTLCDKMVYV